MGIASEKDSEEKAGDVLINHLAELNRTLNIGRLRDAVHVDWAMFDSKLQAMADAALESGSPQNNPRLPTREQIVELYRQAW